jgi:hypothetical protein
MFLADTIFGNLATSAWICSRNDANASVGRRDMTGTVLLPLCLLKNLASLAPFFSHRRHHGHAVHDVRHGIAVLGRKRMFHNAISSRRCFRISVIKKRSMQTLTFLTGRNAFQLRLQDYVLYEFSFVLPTHRERTRMYHSYRVLIPFRAAVFWHRPRKQGN